ncbi:hypothetical protein [Denitrobaculum tricleocarpae]|uniref:Uncharacterized protein n=1 Tax=Denitrobaculum tricleocarpae TaxID=2591009 RepID=A0A545SSY0_9PROT|nr:hypothetical protein [Denitrobaculum tricleocarpae]TQV68088.1 hypothetical protein FKG95_29125 [Denitrobaculum tricleocarpae]
MSGLLVKGMSGRKTIAAVIVVVGLLAALFIPNLIWAGRTSLQIVNTSPWPLEGIEIEFQGGRETLENLPAGDKATILLPVKGETEMTLRYRITPGAGAQMQERGCDAGYIEAGLYYVTAEIDKLGAAVCRVEIASPDRLLIFEMF